MLTSKPLFPLTLFALSIVGLNAFATRLTSMVLESRLNISESSPISLQGRFTAPSNISYAQAQFDAKEIYDLDFSDVDEITAKIERLINQEKCDEKIQELMRLKGMIEGEIRHRSLMKEEKWTFVTEEHEDMRSLQLRELLKRIKRHLDEHY